MEGRVDDCKIQRCIGFESKWELYTYRGIAVEAVVEFLSRCPAVARQLDPVHSRDI